jgi:hypothetical protein
MTREVVLRVEVAVLSWRHSSVGQFNGSGSNCHSDARRVQPRIFISTHSHTPLPI